MNGFELVLIVLAMIPAALICWAVVKSGETQRIRDQLRALRAAARHRLRKLFLVAAVATIVLGVAVIGAFSTGHATLGLALLVGLVALSGTVAPALRARTVKRNLYRPLARRRSHDGAKTC